MWVFGRVLLCAVGCFFFDLMFCVLGLFGDLLLWCGVLWLVWFCFRTVVCIVDCVFVLFFCFFLEDACSVAVWVLRCFFCVCVWCALVSLLWHGCVLSGLCAFSCLFLVILVLFGVFFVAGCVFFFVLWVLWLICVLGFLCFCLGVFVCFGFSFGLLGVVWFVLVVWFFGALLLYLRFIFFFSVFFWAVGGCCWLFSLIEIICVCVWVLFFYSFVFACFFFFFLVILACFCVFEFGVFFFVFAFFCLVFFLIVCCVFLHIVCFFLVFCPVLVWLVAFFVLWLAFGVFGVFGVYVSFFLVFVWLWVCVVGFLIFFFG